MAKTPYVKSSSALRRTLHNPYMTPCIRSFDHGSHGLTVLLAAETTNQPPDWIAEIFLFLLLASMFMTMLCLVLVCLILRLLLVTIIIIMFTTNLILPYYCGCYLLSRYWYSYCYCLFLIVIRLGIAPQ